MSKLKFIGGIILTLFNVGVFIFTQNEISPEYFEVLFALYFLISLIVGIKLILENRYAFCTDSVTEGEDEK